VSKIFCNPADFIPTLLALISKNRYKIIELSFFDIKNININFNKYPIQLDKDKNIIKIKTGNKIRNPKDFDLFVDTFIETQLLSNNNLLPGEIIIKDTHPRNSYIQEKVRKLVEEPLESQSGQIITTQQLEPIIVRGYKTYTYNRTYKA